MSLVNIKMLKYIQNSKYNLVSRVLVAIHYVIVNDTTDVPLVMPDLEEQDTLPTAAILSLS